MLLTDDPFIEELAAPRPNRFGRALLILLILVAAGGVIVRTAGSGSSSDNAAQRTPSSAAPTTLPLRPVTPTVRRVVVVPRFRPVPRCPRGDDGLAACTAYPGLAASVVQALRERFPRIVVERAVTRILRPVSPRVRPRLWSRAIRGHVGALKLRIAVRRAEPQDGATVGLRQAKRLQLIRYIRDHYLVQFELRGPVVPESLSNTIAWLLTEPRLVRPAVAARGTMVR